jgi:hypothetical protein
MADDFVEQLVVTFTRISRELGKIKERNEIISR